jgi:glutathione synthase/RimK-type ligase-like ATP-grasp enzyme
MNFETFNSVDHLPLRVYNRVVYMTNILTDFGKEAVKKYIEMFTESERQQMFLMQAYIKANGVDATRKFVTKDLKVVYNAEQE